MTRAHDRDVWSLDRRPILTGMLGEGPEALIFQAHTGTVFERFERNGEMAAIPYLRATASGHTVEAPLVRWGMVTFGEDPAP